MSLKETKVYSVNDFMNWNKNEELLIAPKYQRKEVWDEKAKSYLIDTILRGLPVPQIFIRQKIDTNLGLTTREVIDGQQRLRALIGFFGNEFPVMKIHNKEFGGKYYKDLSSDEKEQFLDYQLPVELIKSPDDNVIYDMFMRVNTNSVILNRQELRNAKYWGDLKVLAYNLSSKWRPFISSYNVIRERDIIRMYDVEFISRLLRVLIDGIVQDTPGKLDNFYQRNENIYNSEEIESRFNKVFSIIDKMFNDVSFSAYFFNKPNYLYSLFAFIVFKEFQIRDFEFHTKPMPTDREIFIRIKKLEEELVNIKEGTLAEVFIGLHSIRTTNQAERIRRVKMLIDFVTSGDFISSYE